MVLNGIWMYITTLQMVDPQNENENPSNTAFSVGPLFETVRVALVVSLGVCGVVYMLMGCLCISYFKNAQMRKVSVGSISILSLPIFPYCIVRILQIKQRKQFAIDADLLQQQKADIDRLLEETNKKLQVV